MSDVILYRQWCLWNGAKDLIPLVDMSDIVGWLVYNSPSAYQRNDIFHKKNVTKVQKTRRL